MSCLVTSDRALFLLDDKKRKEKGKSYKSALTCGLYLKGETNPSLTLHLLIDRDRPWVFFGELRPATEYVAVFDFEGGPQLWTLFRTKAAFDDTNEGESRSDQPMKSLRRGSRSISRRRTSSQIEEQEIERGEKLVEMMQQEKEKRRWKKSHLFTKLRNKPGLGLR